MDRLEAVLREKGITIFARIDHAAGAASVDMRCGRRSSSSSAIPRPAPLMQARQSIGIDLPAEDAGLAGCGRQSLAAYNDPAWLARGMGWSEAEAAVAGLAKALAMLAAGAVA
jgi:Uncharacterized conserved protein